MSTSGYCRCKDCREAAEQRANRPTLVGNPASKPSRDFWDKVKQVTKERIEVE